MLETPHVIVAAAIAYKIGNPALAIPLALGSHFVLEKVPHWNPHLNTEIRKFGRLSKTTMSIIYVDTAIAIISGVYISTLALPDVGHFLTILVACFAGVVPDLAEAPYFIWRKKSNFSEKLVSFQKSIQNDTNFKMGLFTQIITIVAAAVWIIKR